MSQRVSMFAEVHASCEQEESERGSVGGVKTVHWIHQSRVGRPLGALDENFETVDTLA